MPPDEMRGILAEAGFSEDFAAQVVAFGEALNCPERSGPSVPGTASLTPTTFEEFAGELARAFQPA